MKLIAIALVSLVLTSPASAKLVTEKVDYKDDAGTALHGFVAYDDATAGKRPGVLVIHDWRGLSDTTRTRAEMLAKLGYIAFAADIYGKDISSAGIPAWVKEAGVYKNDRTLYRERARAAYDTFLRVRSLPAPP